MRRWKHYLKGTLSNGELVDFLLFCSVQQWTVESFAIPGFLSLWFPMAATGMLMCELIVLEGCCSED